MLDHEAGLVVALERLGRQAFHGAGLAGAAHDHLAGLLDVETRLLGEGEGIGHAHHGPGESDLVGELGRLTAARAVEAAELGGERLEHLAHRGDVLLRRADDTRERAGDGTGLAARHRAVEGHAVRDLGGLGDIAGELGRARGEVDEDGTRLARGEQAVARQVELLDVGRVAHHGEDDIGPAGGLGRAVRPHSTTHDQVVCLGLGVGVDSGRSAFLEDMTSK